MSEVTIEGGWNNNDGSWDSLVNEVFAKLGSLSVGMSSTDENNTSDTMLVTGCANGLELFHFELKFTGISEVV